MGAMRGTNSGGSKKKELPENSWSYVWAPVIAALSAERGIS